MFWRDRVFKVVNALLTIWLLCTFGKDCGPSFEETCHYAMKQFYPLAPEFVRLYHKTRICKKNTFCTYGSFGRYSSSTLLSSVSNFPYWFAIVSPCFVTRYNVRKLSLIEFGKHFEQSLSGLYYYTVPVFWSSVNVCCISIW